MVLNLASYGTMLSETVHSGHFMISSLTDESSDTDSGLPMHVGSIQTANIPVSRDFIRNPVKRQSHDHERMLGSSVADVIDGSLITLLKCMTLDYRFAQGRSQTFSLGVLPFPRRLPLPSFLLFSPCEEITDTIGFDLES